MSDRRRDVALFRYSLIREAADPALTNAERGVLVRALAARDHVGPGGARVRVARNTVDRWIRAWKVGGFDALVPAGRIVEPSTPAAMLDLAVKLKREVPGRTAAQVAEIIAASQGWSPSRRTVQRLFANLGLNTRPDGSPPAVFGRFEAAAANDRWTGDALHGPVVGGHKAYLFAFIDDYSRAIPGYRWGHSEDTVRLEAALRHGLASRGIPRSIYVDNGSAFVAAPLLRACAVLGIRLVHSRPGRPEGRGKIERFFRTVRDQFLVEISARGDIGDLIEMNRLFAAWIETAYHRRVHSETKAAPLERFMAGGAFLLPTPDQLHEAFLWSEQRMSPRPRRSACTATPTKSTLPSSAAASSSSSTRSTSPPSRSAGKADRWAKACPVSSAVTPTRWPNPNRSHRPRRPASTTSLFSPTATPPSWPSTAHPSTTRRSSRRPTLTSAPASS